MPSSDWLIVHDPRAARALRKPPLRDTLHVLMEREGTVSDVARTLEVTLNAAYLNVRALEQAGLVCLAREQRRAGRAIRHYRPVAKQLFVPFDVTDVTDLEALYWQNLAEQSRLLVRSILAACRGAWGQPSTLGTSHYLDEAGRAMSAFGPQPGTTWSRLDDDSPATTLMSGALWLTFDEAKAMQRELSQLHARYARREPGRRPYRLVVGLAPQETPAPEVDPEGPPGQRPEVSVHGE